MRRPTPPTYKTRNARKHGGAKRRVWRKIHNGIDEKSLEIRAAEFTTSDVGAAPMLFEASQNPMPRSAAGVVAFALATALRTLLARGQTDFAAEKAWLHARLVHGTESGDTGGAVGLTGQILSVDEGHTHAA